ncbi:natural resistance-associated macrophage protein-domain-containing protein [Mycena pura]|uniref:Natural resistance-associated macrophage protein-domain-containing protein n=1 Tax=Mycena pura TaxID=153505 RepID=A0AAD6YE83_9AGAR|nr:natural resistance-associated macrophage protein-domain-containing protein [Mycena pura]
MFEIFIACLVLAVLICMVVVVSKVHVLWGEAFKGFLPSKDLFGASGLYTSVGILGATVMPHSLFLGSALSTQNRLSEDDPSAEKLKSLQVICSRETTSTTTQSKPSILSRLLEFFAAQVRTPPPSPHSTCVRRHSDRENNSLAFIRAHLNHGICDVVGSLLGFAVLINSMILIVAAMVFYYGRGSVAMDESGNLFDAYDIIYRIIGAPAATLFAVSLLAAGQSSSIIATLAGQAVAEGFLNWRLSPVVRRLFTRLIAVIPSMAVAIACGQDGIDSLLVASQVVLALVLPFIIFPLIFLTSSKTVMRVRKPGTDSTAWDGTVDYSSGKVATLFGCAIGLTVVAANVYVLVSLIQGAAH